MTILLFLADLGVALEADGVVDIVDDGGGDGFWCCWCGVDGGMDALMEAQDSAREGNQHDPDPELGAP